MKNTIINNGTSTIKIDTAHEVSVTEKEIVINLVLTTFDLVKPKRKYKKRTKTTTKSKTKKSVAKK